MAENCSAVIRVYARGVRGFRGAVDSVDLILGSDTLGLLARDACACGFEDCYWKCHWCLLIFSDAFGTNPQQETNPVGAVVSLSASHDLGLPVRATPWGRD